MSKKNELREQIYLSSALLVRSSMAVETK